jgi:hypothetical protein
MRIVQPTINTQQLFDDNPYLTRLYTTISPIDMNMDPVFSENPDLPEVSLIHSATLTYPCGGDPWLHTGQGFEIQYPDGAAPTASGLPPSLRLETLREEGAPTVITDNSDAIVAAAGPVSHGSNQASSSPSSSSSSGSMGGCACDVSARARNQLSTGLMVLAAALFVARRRRRIQR